MAKGASLASAARAQAVYLAYRGLGAGMELLPEAAAEASANAVGLALTVGRRDARAMYARNLERVLGRKLGEREAKAWA
ncbi:MAG TPA: hypothetical protein VMR97_11165, partial [Acidimicrobiales bacterium]|nr:hypothetical protein [Acidimicrobiales bacterium]